MCHVPSSATYRHLHRAARHLHIVRSTVIVIHRGYACNTSAFGDSSTCGTTGSRCLIRCGNSMQLASHLKQLSSAMSRLSPIAGHSRPINVPPPPSSSSSSPNKPLITDTGRSLSTGCVRCFGCCYQPISRCAFGRRCDPITHPAPMEGVGFDTLRLKSIARQSIRPMAGFSGDKLVPWRCCRAVRKTRKPESIGGCRVHCYCCCQPKVDRVHRAAAVGLLSATRRSAVMAVVWCGQCLSADTILGGAGIPFFNTFGSLFYKLKLVTVAIKTISVHCFPCLLLYSLASRRIIRWLTT